jgi:hypothetical protein
MDIKGRLANMIDKLSCLGLLLAKYIGIDSSIGAERELPLP